MLDPKAKVTYEDDEYELFRSPSDPNKKYTLEDAFAFQRNRFEHLNGRFVQMIKLVLKNKVMMEAKMKCVKISINMRLEMKMLLMPMFIRSIQIYQRYLVGLSG